MSELDIIDDAAASLAPVSTASILARAGVAANTVATQNIFGDYRDRVSRYTLTRQDSELTVFARYLAAAGVTVDALALAEDPEAWRGMTWGLIAGFVQWQLREGYALGTVNVRLSTVKRYASLAFKAGTVSADEYAKIRLVQGYTLKEADRVNKQRPRQRRGPKKAAPTRLTLAQARRLKQQPDTPQGRRDRLLLCLLLDHGLRVGELVQLQVDALDLIAGTMRFHRPKVSKDQTHKLSPDTHRAALAYGHLDAADSGPLLKGSKKNGELDGTIGIRCIAYRVRALGEAIGLDHLSPHDLRHYWATAASRGGTALKALQDAGGWASPSMPLKYIASSVIANEDVKLEL